MKKILIGFIAVALFAGGFVYASGARWYVKDTLSAGIGSGVGDSEITYQRTYDETTNAMCYTVFTTTKVIPQSVSISCVK